MSADNRTVATDALATLGTILTGNEKRDAIHLAVIPVVAGQTLAAGADVYIGADGKAYHLQMVSKAYNYVGIVDPFLVSEDDQLPVKAGDRFWLVIYPRKITSLRHVWEHPAFPDEESTVARSAESISSAQMRLESVAREAGYDDLDELLRVIDEESKYGYISAAFGHEPDTRLDEHFWRDWSIVTGKPVPDPDTRASYFSCSC